MIPTTVPPGIEVRPYRLGDAAALFEVVDGDREHLRRYLHWVDATESATDAARFVRFAVETAEAGKAIHCGLFDGEAQIGGVGAGLIPVDRTADIGYWITSRWQGRGIVTAAVSELLEELFEVRDIHRVSIRAATENHRSQAVPQRLGFTHEGRQRDAGWIRDRVHDYEVYALLAHEWRAARDA